MKKRKLLFSIGLLLIPCYFLAGVNGGFLAIGDSQFPSLYQKEQGIVVFYKAYDKQECKAVLGKDFLRKGYQPIQISVENNSVHPYFLSKAGVSYETATSNEVALSSAADSIPRSIFYKIMGFLYFPLMIPSMIESFITFKNNLDMKKELYAKSVKEEEETIPPFSVVSRVIFVSKEEYGAPLSLTLINADSGREETFTSS